MNCAECDGIYIEKKGSVTLPDRILGEFEVHGLSYEQCPECGDLLFSMPSARKIYQARKQQIDAALKAQPLRNFMTCTEVATFLGMTRQAVHKNARIRRGYILQTTFNRKTVYLRESVLRYKFRGDGRFSLRPAGAHSPYKEDACSGIALTYSEKTIVGLRGDFSQISGQSAHSVWGPLNV